MTTTYVPKPRRVTYKLTRQAREQIKASGITIADYVRGAFPYSETWRGDVCGCFDDRCIGYHHDERDDCGCIAPCIADVKAGIAWVTA